MMLKNGVPAVLDDAVTRPANPGSRWCSGAMAFRVWVRQAAPALMAVMPVSYEAFEWPKDTTMPLLVRLLTSAAESSSSGAIVTSLSMLHDSAAGPYTSMGGVEGTWKRSALCAPFLLGQR